MSLGCTAIEIWQKKLLCNLYFVLPLVTVSASQAFVERPFSVCNLLMV